MTPVTIPTQTNVATQKRAFVITSSDGTSPLCARIPTDLRVGAAIDELAAYAGFPPAEQIDARYALLATADSGDLLLVSDNTTFGDLPEGNTLHIAAQPRPA